MTGKILTLKYKISFYKTLKIVNDWQNFSREIQNLTFKRAKFKSCKQEPAVSVDSFITDLHCLAHYCNYGNLHGEMVCERIIIGIHDSKLSQRMHTEADLTC